MNHLKINLEFRDLIPPLTHDEYSRLEQNLIQEGCRDAIKTWRGTILDGHNRYEICTKHGLKYDNMPMSFSSRNDAKGWIIDNQLGRRNLPDAAYIELAIQKMELGRYKNPNTGNKRKIIAQLSGKSESNVHRYMKIRKLGNAELVKAVKHGEIKIGEAYKNLEACKYVEITTKTELCPGWVPKMKRKPRKFVAIFLSLIFLVPTWVYADIQADDYKTYDSECMTTNGVIDEAYLIEAFDIRHIPGSVYDGYYFRLVESAVFTLDEHENIKIIIECLNIFHASSLQEIIDFVAFEMIIYIEAAEVPTLGPIPSTPSIFVEDVYPEDWFYRYVVAGLRFEILTGVSSETLRFVPDRKVTRAELITMLGRLHEYGHGTIGTPGEGPFYQRYLEWAVEMGIMHGNQHGDLMPRSPVSREQMTVIIYRYIDIFDLWDYFHHDYPLVAAPFTDILEASSWAAGQVAVLHWHLMAFSRYPGMRFRPHDSIRRAEALEMVTRIGSAVYDLVHPMPQY